ncbi:hypothetical protein MBM_06566 [Drepanopeziza brunnea f. sp. 'multigermtubi' MB_m1]|uniref:Uncharacterized protein n=1 Tax=Marssonina brunnea f. sp. multigermtubi (strain MB_m1) TaxID=1072389 RepID=K1WD73_MARBU|nr:uncharacterized protein MBM_06566 [Drepanopeziza brunnea f. sp. 'multigermtubi' MB_m1]EKD15350.1 hypothetical protein MBM_06566 [Drepanopeziza brunnea f. sp. 'multigermtubi' MB_m1]
MPKFSLAFSSPHSQSCSDGSKNETGLMKPTVCLHIQNLDNRLEDDEKNQHAGRLKNSYICVAGIIPARSNTNKQRIKKTVKSSEISEERRHFCTHLLEGNQSRAVDELIGNTNNNNNNSICFLSIVVENHAFSINGYMATTSITAARLPSLSLSRQLKTPSPSKTPR